MDLRDAGIYDIENLFTGKPTIAHDGAKSGGSIINAKQKRIINIPAYQRPYRWKEEYINRLFSDYYDDNSGQYFLGSTVAVEKKRDRDFVQFDLVDGQQRITTLYLLNYIRFLLNRYRLNYVAENKSNTVKLGEYIKQLRHSYEDLVGKNNIDKILELEKDVAALDEIQDSEKRALKLKSCVQKWLFIAELQENKEDTIKETRKQMRMFFEHEQLCLSYSRERYVDLLRKALTHVYLDKLPMTTKLILEGVENDDNDPEYSYYRPYLVALKCLFDNLIEKAMEKPSKSEIESINNAIQVTDDLLQNLCLCIVVTENEDDAYKLFEVLNDRSLDMEDLELIKNHFYKEYCTKSNEDSKSIDKNIEKLEEIWVDKVFLTNNPLYLNNLISYFAAVYFTSNMDLDNKNNARYKNAINRYYSSQYCQTKPYTFDLAVRDFYVYYAVKILLVKFDIWGMYFDQIACDAEVKNNVSITYKTMCLLNAMRQTAVMAGLINMILATYWKYHTSFDETTYNKFIDELIHDGQHVRDEFKLIHKQAHIIWSTCIRAKDYKLPRTVASSLIAKYGIDQYDGNIVELTVDQNDKVNNEFKEWYNNFRYGYGTDLKIKILLLRLLSWTRTEPASDPYKARRIKIVPAAISYNLNGRKVQLDHLEPKNIVPGTDKYFLKDNLDERSRIVNQNVGNLMVLDADDNNRKKNSPLYYAATHYYKKMKDSWLIKDIIGMLNDDQFFDKQKQIPKIDFFTTRTERLYRCFSAVLNASLYSTGEEVVF